VRFFVNLVQRGSLSSHNFKLDAKTTTEEIQHQINMSLFLPNNVAPIAPAANLDNWNDQIDSESFLANADFFKKPTGMENRNVEINYHQL
jgi:hypothetical protein